MFINKIGSRHLEAGTNCQDFGFIKDDRKVVVDGCSGTPHSEVGAKLFCFLLQGGMTITEAFDKLIMIFPDKKSQLDHCCFTYFEAIEFEEHWEVRYCGDGYIIKQWIDGTISLDEIYNGEYPEYFIYNYIDPQHLGMYKDGVKIKTEIFSKKLYKNIGVATDGIDYIIENEYDEEFENLLIKGNESSIKRFINRHNGISLFNLFNGITPADIYELLEEFSTKLKDDISIAF